ncbi:MAG: hypothetical protein J6584_09015 [Lactobacillus sp.]|nr:hypothetical protein [Lactobacillus sp.]
MITKKDFKANWQHIAELSKDDLFFPYKKNSDSKSSLIKALSTVVSDKDKNIGDKIVKPSKFTNYNATIGQNYEDYQYSYEEGYFNVFKLTIAESFHDSDSYLMPALFLARHYAEICLKNEIINISIATGTPFIIGESKNHSLKKLNEKFKKLLDDNDLNILNSNFFEIIDYINELTPKSDEYRYNINKKGKYNLPVDHVYNNHAPRLINLIVLGQYINSLYVYLSSLQRILNDSDGSILSDTFFSNPSVKGILYGILFSKKSKKVKEFLSQNQQSNIKQWIDQIIKDNILKINPSDIKVEEQEIGKKYLILIANKKLFEIFKEYDLWKLKTDSFIED